MLLPGVRGRRHWTEEWGERLPSHPQFPSLWKYYARRMGLAFSACPVSAYIDDPGAASDCDHAQIAEIRAAILERQAEVGGVDPGAIAADDDMDAADINAYRAAIEALIPLFYNPATGNAWTKSALFAALGLGSDWTTISGRWPADGGPTYAATLPADTIKYAEHVNEMYEVVRALRWLGIVQSSFSVDKNYAVSTGSNTSWAAAISAMKTMYGATYWADAPGNVLCGFRLEKRKNYGGYTYHIRIYNWRLNSVGFAVPDYAVAVTDTKLLYSRDIFSDGGSGAGNTDLFEGANFTGTKHDIVNDGATSVIIDVATVAKNATAYYSARNDPYSATFSAEQPDPDSYIPADPTADGDAGVKRRGYDTRLGPTASLGLLLVELGFAYV